MTISRMTTTATMIFVFFFIRTPPFAMQQGFYPVFILYHSGTENANT